MERRGEGRKAKGGDQSLGPQERDQSISSTSETELKIQLTARHSGHPPGHCQRLILLSSALSSFFSAGCNPLNRFHNPQFENLWPRPIPPLKSKIARALPGEQLAQVYSVRLFGTTWAWTLTQKKHPTHFIYPNVPNHMRVSVLRKGFR